MNGMRGLVFAAVCSLAQPIAALASEAEVLAILKPVGDAAIRGDFAAAIDVVYEPVLEDLGGRKAFLEGVAKLQEQMEAQGMRVKSHTYGRPFRFIRGRTQRFVVVPTVTEMTFRGGAVRAHSFELGVEVAPGKWRFLNGSQVKKETIAKYFPDFPADEKLPEIKHEMLTK